MISKTFYMLFFIFSVFNVNPENYPDWYLNPVKSNELIYAVGVANYKNEQVSIEAANIRARKELSFVIVTNVTVMTRDFLEENHFVNSGSSEEFTQLVSKQISDTVIEKSVVEKIHVDKSTKPPTYYLLISIKTSDLKKSFEETMKENENKLSRMKNDPDNADTKNKIPEKKIDDKSISDMNNSNGFDNIETKIKTGKTPQWVEKYPVSDEFYIGIGQGKTLQQAKDFAVNSIVSQIKVKVKSEINDYIKEVKGITEEEVSQNIKLTVNESIEDLQEYDLYYSKDKNYWAYYRLNIAEYKRKQLELMESARIRALDYLKKSLGEKDPALSMKFAFIGYMTIGKYITKSLKADLYGREIIIVNELIARIQDLLKTFVITTLSPEIKISKLSSSPVEFDFMAKCNNQLLINFPFRAVYDANDNKSPEKSITDDTGKGFFIMENIRKDKQNQIIKIEPDLIKFLAYQTLENEQTFNDETFIFIERIIALGIPSREIAIKFNDLVFNFSIAIKNNLDSDKQYVNRIQTMSQEFKNAFIKKTKVKFSEYSPEYLMMFDVDGNILRSELSGQFFTRMIITVKIKDLSSGNEIFTKSTPEIKGGSITGIRSLQSACEKYLKEYNAGMIERIMAFINN